MNATTQTTSPPASVPASTPSEKPATEQRPSESVSLLNEGTPESKPTTTPSETKTPETKTEPKEGDKPKAPEGAPEKYESFKVPDGFEVDEEVMGEAQTVFKEAGLSQAAAQRLVDFYAKVSQKAAEAPINYWVDKQKAWQDEIKADPDIGGSKLGAVRANVAKMYDAVIAIDPKNTQLVSDFREAMDYTGAGNNPAFVKFMNIIASRFTEGTHVAGDRGKPKPGSAAQAMYPDLPSQG